MRVLTAPLSVAVDMTFPNRNPAGSGVYANELLAQLRRRDDLRLGEISAPAQGFGNTMRWLVNGARRATGDARLLHCPAFVAPWRTSVPMVLTVHDTSTLRFPEDHPLEWRVYARFLLPERARAAARVITGTEFTRHEITRDLQLRDDQVVVTPYGVSERFSGVRRPLTAPRTPPLLLFPGAPVRRKNLELVLNAMAQAPEASVLRRARLAITGSDANRFPRHRSLIAELGLSARVEWRGNVRAEAMPEELAGADVVVYPSLYEGFGFPALEAMLVGTPVVASNAACLPEVLGDGALLVDPHDAKAFIDAVEAATIVPQVRGALIERGRARAERFTWSRCAEQTMQVYRNAIGQTPP
jgi:glycosyltransferase involved in cell wall biosynthesis